MHSAAKSQNPLYVAAIGASAGGLEALHKLLAYLPTDIDNLAIVIVQHLSPDFKSFLIQSLTAHTRLQVVGAKNSLLMRGGFIYVTPADCEISTQNGKIRLLKSGQLNSPHPSINSFMHSLAADQKDKAIGIILSGTGSDGAQGLKEIKFAGGCTIVQEPSSATYNSMPLASIKTGVIDYVLNPEKIGETLRLHCLGKGTKT